MAEKYKGIIFDMDGVLVDSEAFYYQRRKNFLKEYGLSIEQLPIQKFIGADMRSLWEMILEENDWTYDVSFLNEKYQLYKKEHPIDYTQLIDPDAKRILQFLKRGKYKIGLASSSLMEVIVEVLTISQLTSYFDVVVSGEQFEKSKPEPDIYLHTVSELSLTPAECLAIEDSEKGIASAVTAGLAVAALKDTKFGMNQQAASIHLDKLSDICKILQEGTEKTDESLAMLQSQNKS